MGAVVDRSRWPVVTVCVGGAGDLETLADELGALLGEERSFALAVVAPGSIEQLQEMLWTAPEARRRLRRMRPRLAAWCEAAAHVLDADAYARTMPSDLRYAELIWGCATLAADCEEEAEERLLERLSSRPLPLELEAV